MTYTCKIEEQPLQPVLSIRTRCSVEDLPNTIGSAYGSIMNYLNEMGEGVSGAPFVAYYNMDMKDLDIEIGFPVFHPLDGRDTIQSSNIPAGKYGSCIHIGPYQEMGPAYETLTKYIADNGYTPSGIAYEIYYNSPEEVPESLLQTKISFLLNE